MTEGEIPQPDRKIDPKEAARAWSVKFFNAVVNAQFDVLAREFPNIGKNVNTKLEKTGATALHYAAGHRARPLLRWLIKNPELDFLVTDREGRLPSEIAYEVTNDFVMGRYLAKKENEQARERGIDIRTLLAKSLPTV